jgi:hypothetical protein
LLVTIKYIPAVSRTIETKKRKFCTGASIVICIAFSSVKKTFRANKMAEPPIMKQPPLTLEMIIRATQLAISFQVKYCNMIHIISEIRPRTNAETR